MSTSLPFSISTPEGASNSSQTTIHSSRPLYIIAACDHPTWAQNMFPCKKSLKLSAGTNSTPQHPAAQPSVPRGHRLLPTLDPLPCFITAATGKQGLKEPGQPRCEPSLKEDYNQLRPLSYPNTDVFLICFSVVNPASYHNVQEEWVPELKDCMPHVPYVLIGTQIDLRDDPKTLARLLYMKEKPLTYEHGVKLAKAAPNLNNTLE
uniref:Ras homolog family member J n=1 Tax=Equus caballus TaxID=9796 RepID=A0A9L0S304_HORSE